MVAKVCSQISKITFRYETPCTKISLNDLPGRKAHNIHRCIHNCISNVHDVEKSKKLMFLASKGPYLHKLRINFFDNF